jgi:type IV pilus assembly protein PilQ
MTRTQITTITVLAAYGIAGFVSCGHGPAERVAPTQGSKTLERITVTESGDRVHVVLLAGGPISYALSTSMAPPSVTVDLPGMTKGKELQRVEVKKAPVLEIVPNEVTKPREGVQLVVLLSEAVKPDVRSDGPRLLIDFPRGDVPAARPTERPHAQDSVGPITTTQPSAAPAKTVTGPTAPAKSMTRIEVQKREGAATVVIAGDGELAYEVTPLSQDRLVVDLPHVTSQLRGQVLPVDHPLLRQIRIGHHAEKVRLVFDLLQPASYTVLRNANALSIGLTSIPRREPRGTNGSAQEAEAGDPTAEKPAGANASAGRVEVAKVPPPSVSERLAEAARKAPLAQMAPEARGLLEPEAIGEKRYVGRRISMDFQQADITNVLRLIADVSGFNIVVGESVKAKVTLKLVSVPWDQALDMLLKMNNLGMIREGNIVWIDTLTNIARMQDEEAKAKEAKIKAEDLITKIIYVQNVQAQELQTTLRQYLSPRGQLQLNQASNALIVQDTESRVSQFSQLVRDLDIEVPQVQIEARVVQADTSYSRSLGVQWGITDVRTTNSRYYIFGNPTGPYNEPGFLGPTPGEFTQNFIVNLPATVSGLSNVPALGFQTGSFTGGLVDLDLRLSAGELLGLTKVIAAPKISTLDKREAKIEQGESIPFQTTSLQGTQTTFVDANLTLQVTPQITSRDPKEAGKQILLKVRVTRNAVGARSNPAGPSIDKREATTQVLVRDGETMVIGGIFVDTQSNNVAGMPWMDRIPVLGWMFKQKTENVSKQELLIFLTPAIIKT